MIGPDVLVVVAAEPVWCDLGGETAILDARRGVYYGLDGIGTRIWQLLQSPTTVSELSEVLVDEYEVERAVCERDVGVLVADLARAGLVDVRADG